MKVSVEPGKCQGHTLCAIAAPELFKLREDDGHAYVDGNGEVPKDLEGKAYAAAATCPEQAITISCPTSTPDGQ